MSKRILALFCALAMLAGAAFALDTTEEMRAENVVIFRNHLEMLTDTQEIVIDYPTFTSADQQLADFLNEFVTLPIQAMHDEESLAEEDAYADGARDVVRGGFYASLDFEGILSIEASLRTQAAGSENEEIAFFSAVVDLNGKRLLPPEELFQEPSDVVEEAVCNAVYAKAGELGILTETITNAGLVRLPDSFVFEKEALRVLYAPGAISTQAAVLDLPWDELPLTWAPVLSGQPAMVELTPAPDGGVSIGVIGGADGPTSIIVSDELSDEEMALLQLVLADESTGAGMQELPAVTPVPGEILEEAAEAADETQFVTPEPAPTPLTTVTPFPVETINPHFSLPPVVTPTPMPAQASDALLIDALTNGLWKQLGTDGSVYYQFTADGKLLTISVSHYTVEDGQLESDVFSGTLDVGSDSAFTLRDDDRLYGYVLNRQGERVAPEEFVTPSPTPVPTPTPSPTPTPTPTPSPTPEPTPTPTPSPSPTPSPTPTPAPTLSPYERALQTAPRLEVQPDAAFEKARTLKVYGAPGEDSWSAEGAQVTTDETAAIYGVEDGWVLVSYAIGNGSRGRMGYIDDRQLDEDAKVEPLDLVRIPCILTRNAKATDDPLRGRNTLTTLRKGEEVVLLAFMDSDWAYVETTLDDRVCRLFIPESALR